MNGESGKRRVATGLGAAVMALGGVALALLVAACGGGSETLVDQLAYIDAAGKVRLVNSDGSGGSTIADTSDCGRFPSLVWSPDGLKLACVGSGSNDEGLVALIDPEEETATGLKLPGPVSLFWSPDGGAIAYTVGGDLHVADASGEDLGDLGPIDVSPTTIAVGYQGLQYWSPDGSQLAYRPADATEIRIYSLDQGSQRSLAGDYRPLAWVLNGKALLVAAKYQPPGGEGYPTYEADLLDLAGGGLARVPELDNGRQFWVSPDGTHAAVLTQSAGSPPGLAVLALPTLEFSPIPDSVITYGSDHIPSAWVTFTADGSQIYWITQWQTGTAVFRANSDGTGLTEMSEFESPGAAFSPDLTMIGYQVLDDTAHTVTLYTANIDGTGVHEIDSIETEIGRAGFPWAWRPTP